MIPRFMEEFSNVIHTNGYDLYVKKGITLPNNPIPQRLLTEHSYCGTGKLPKKGEW